MPSRMWGYTCFRWEAQLAHRVMMASYLLASKASRLCLATSTEVLR